MIIRRISKGIKEQDWFVVMVEVMIVVAGIFIGLQVDDWNEERKDRIEELLYLDRLLTETNKNIEAVDLFYQRHQNRIKALSFVISKLQENKIDEIPFEQMETVFCYWYIPEAIKLQTSVYDELISSGSLKLIRSVELRNALQGSFSILTQLISDGDKLKPTLVSKAEKLSKHIKWNNESIGSDGVSCSVDLKGVQNDPNGISQLVQLYRGQFILVETSREFIQDLEQLRNEISNSIKAIKQ